MLPTNPTTGHTRSSVSRFSQRNVRSLTTVGAALGCPWCDEDDDEEEEEEEDEDDELLLLLESLRARACRLRRPRCACPFGGGACETPPALGICAAAARKRLTCCRKLRRRALVALRIACS